jgi:hypothetical protein
MLSAEIEYPRSARISHALPKLAQPSAPCHQGREGVLFQSVSFEPPVEAALPHELLLLRLSQDEAVPFQAAISGARLCFFSSSPELYQTWYILHIR